jgi:hypothetical protein
MTRTETEGDIMEEKEIEERKWKTGNRNHAAHKSGSRNAASSVIKTDMKRRNLRTN